jgi:hypothetical protein
MDRSVPTTPVFYCYMHLLLDGLQLSLLVPGGGLAHSQKIVIVEAYGSPTIVEDLKAFDLRFGRPGPHSGGAKEVKT